MKYILILFLAITQISCSQPKPEPTDTPDIEVMEDSNSLLWMITSDDMEDTSFLFGTMHMIQKEYFIFPETLGDFASSSDVMIMELAGMPDPYEMMKHIMLPKGESMFDYFDEEQEDSLVAWVTENTSYSEDGLRSTFGRMKPFALVQLTALSQFEGDIESYEEDFVKIAKKHEIEIIGLETAAQQMKIFDDLTDEEMTEMVMSSIRDDADEAAEQLENMQATYQAQLLDSLYSIIHSEGGMLAEKESAFLTDRNKNWIPKITKIIKDKSAFIAVGAGHLAGEEGVIKLLEKKGYTLTPIHL